MFELRPPQFLFFPHYFLQVFHPLSSFEPSLNIGIPLVNHVGMFFFSATRLMDFPAFLSQYNVSMYLCTISVLLLKASHSILYVYRINLWGWFILVPVMQSFSWLLTFSRTVASLNICLALPKNFLRVLFNSSTCCKTHYIKWRTIEKCWWLVTKIYLAQIQDVLIIIFSSLVFKF